CAGRADVPAVAAMLLRGRAVLQALAALARHEPGVHADTGEILVAENTHDLLRGIIAETRCKPNWSFFLVDEDGALRLVIRVAGVDSFRPECKFTVDHYHPVPSATFNKKSWRRWIFDQCLRTEVHELGEWLRFGEGAAECRPFLPTHG